MCCMSNESLKSRNSKEAQLISESTVVVEIQAKVRAESEIEIPKIRQIEIENQQLRQQYYQTLAKSNVRGIDQLLSLWTTLCR